MYKRIAAALTALLLAIAVVLTMASPAGAHESNTAVDVSWDATHWKHCANDAYSTVSKVKVCVQPYGDVLWVLDQVADGHGVGLFWEDLDSDRSGECWNPHGASVGWTRCDKDFAEGHRIKWVGTVGGSFMTADQITTV